MNYVCNISQCGFWGGIAWSSRLSGIHIPRPPRKTANIICGIIIIRLHVILSNGTLCIYGTCRHHFFLICINPVRQTHRGHLLIMTTSCPEWWTCIQPRATVKLKPIKQAVMICKYDLLPQIDSSASDNEFEKLKLIALSLDVEISPQWRFQHAISWHDKVNYI